MMYTFDARVTRCGKWWAVEVLDVPDSFVHTQGRDLVEAQSMANEAAALALDVPTDQVSVTLRLDNDEAAQTVANTLAIRQAADEAGRAAAEATWSAAMLLSTHGLTQRDIAALLRVSPQRINQLLNTEVAA